MAKRKLGMSLIVLIVAATTLVSGTYAWFLVGGFAELFDLGFDVIQASGGIEVQGSAGTAHKGSETTLSDTGWGNFLARTDFTATDLLPTDGKYAPVSTANPAGGFYKTTNDGKYFQPDDPTATVGQHYNRLGMKIRATGDAEGAATMTIKISTREGNTETSALPSARVAVVYDGRTEFFGLADSSTLYGLNANPALNTIEDNNGDSIINPDENGSILTTYNLTAMTATDSANEYQGTFNITNIPSDTAGKDITVFIWIEGNDPECTGEYVKPGSGLSVKIEFTGSTSEG